MRYFKDTKYVKKIGTDEVYIMQKTNDGLVGWEKRIGVDFHYFDPFSAENKVVDTSKNEVESIDIPDVVKSKSIFQDMTKSEMEEYAREHFNVDIDRRKNHSNCVETLEDLAASNESK